MDALAKATVSRPGGLSGSGIRWGAFGKEGRKEGQGKDPQARSRPVLDEEGKIWGAGTCLGTVKKEKWVSPERGEGQRAE